MTSVFTITDLETNLDWTVRVVANGNLMYRRTMGGPVPIETRVWSDYTLEVVAVPDGKKKRYTVLRTFDCGDTRVSHYGEKSLAGA